MQTFICQNKRLSYQKEGTGFPVVFIHGFPEDGNVWKHQISFLKEKFTVIVPDLPGSGASAMLDETDSKEVTITDYADCIFALLQHENIKDCLVFGHSMGGYITLALVEKYPHVIRGFGLVHSTAFADSDEKKKIRRKSILTIGQYGSYAFIKSIVPGLFSAYFKQNYSAEIDTLMERGSNFQPAALQQYYTAMMLREDKTSVLKNTQLPVLFFMGKEDNAAPLHDVLQQAHLPSISYIYILEKSAHMGMWEEKEKVNKGLLDFIQDITADQRLGKR
ncbi:MAG: alpha/beta hydrolase [Bacteroidota bacterium]|nr:alpha/beta hydrolase [Bacteroidota bacterium]